jgi:hypothetical protein
MAPPSPSLPTARKRNRCPTLAPDLPANPLPILTDGEGDFFVMCSCSGTILASPLTPLHRNGEWSGMGSPGVLFYLQAAIAFLLRLAKWRYTIDSDGCPLYN